MVPPKTLPNSQEKAMNLIKTGMDEILDILQEPKLKEEQNKNNYNNFNLNTATTSDIIFTEILGDTASSGQNLVYQKPDVLHESEILSVGAKETLKLTDEVLKEADRDENNVCVLPRAPPSLPVRSSQVDASGRRFFKPRRRAPSVPKIPE